MPFDFTPTELETWQQLLLDAARIVRVRWRQGDYGNAGGPRCAVGALREAAALIDEQGLFSDVYTCALLRFGDRLKGTIPKWNDTPGRTAEEVATAMEEAAMETAHV